LPTVYEADIKKAIAEVKAAEIEVQNTKVLSEKM
jgi:membrane fusion protein (multidrug efflux system)